MTQDIKYTGLSANPSDHESPDGDLATAINLIPEDGQLKPIFQPQDLAHLPSGYEVVFIHKTANFTHYIVKRVFGSANFSQTILSWFDASVIDNAASYPVDAETISNSLNYIYGFFHVSRHPINHTVIRTAAPIYSINAIGNTLVVLTDTDMHYILWKDGVYNYLGTHFPELPLSFGLVGEYKSSNNFNVSIGLVPIAEKPDPGESVYFADWPSYGEAKIKEVSNTVLGQANKFIAEEATSVGKFVSPFFVRYALRLYDGSLVMHSSPVLMIPSSRELQAGIVSWTTTTIGGQQFVTDVVSRINAFVCQLDYKCLSSDAINYLQDWRDVIQSVDIFISAPQYSYNQAENVKGWARPAYATKGYSIARLTTDTAYNKTYHDFDTEELILPRHAEETVFEQIRSCANFYKIKSIEISDIPTTRTIINISEGVLSSLVSRELMTDDYDSHDKIFPQKVFDYNSRLNLSNIKKTFAVPMEAAAYVSYKTPYISNIRVNMYVRIKQDGKEYVVMANSFDAPLEIKYNDLEPFVYFYYPNPNAYEVDLYCFQYISTYGNYDITKKKLKLKRHDTLNGAYFFNSWTEAGTTIETLPIESDDLSFNIPNKLYTSEINNPFYFPPTSIVTVGTGTILGISAAAKALSQGQFGQFPLYAFTTDGVWALEVSATGTFSARQPITRDVCVNPDSITQLDSAVLFATNRGIMHIAGSQATCITDVIATEYPFNPLALPYLDDLHAMIHAEDTCLPTQPFLTFLKDCRMLYDYLHQRITLFNTNYSYAYVFSLKSKQWGMTFSDLRGPLNSYPDALAMAYDETNGNKLVSFSGTDEAVSKGLLVSRPLKLGNGDTFKTVRTLIQRGMFSRGDVKLVLYGSRDLEHWYVVGSSTTHEIRNISGTPYKYFRIAAVSTFTPNKSISDATIEVVPKQTNRLH